ncbi:MAG TPA: CehA/McbA family metallohydrolase [Tepidisphaeraceae bacterium]|jgi:hypothetical protein
MRFTSVVAVLLVFGFGVIGGDTFAADVDFQPLSAHAVRVNEALKILGTPLAPDDEKALLQAANGADAAKGVAEIQRVLDRYCLLMVNINPESRVKLERGPAEAELVEQGWRTFLIKVTNEAGVTARFNIQSPNALPLPEAKPEQVVQRWMGILPYVAQPMSPALSGLGVEYRIVSLFSRDSGKREGKIACNVGQGTQDLGFRNDADVLFTAKPAVDLKLEVRDENGKPTEAAFEIRDAAGRVYPPPAKRLAPDLAFHPQVYRADGEAIKLPMGEYRVRVSRGPEYLVQTRTVRVGGPADPPQRFELKRWIDPSLTGWYSGDHHIHAAGCAHYSNPTQGVLASDMMANVIGEDLKVGCNLTWGPCFDFQKQFFTGAIDKVSQYPYLLRYDVEVSGFGSHQSGHLVLLRLKQEIYPGGDSDKHWPTLCLNTLKWAKAQGGVVGPAHSGWGLDGKSKELPNYVVPPYDGIGADEYVVDVTHMVPGPDGKLGPADDFMSTIDTPYVWELNMWYHTLNCGYRTRISGETDFPCIYGERVGMGRSYVKLDGKLDFDQWCEQIRNGRNYVSDGYSHLMDFKVNDVAMGENGSELRLDQPGSIHLTARVAARLNDVPDDRIRNRPYDQKPYWSLERARIGATKTVPVEVIVNGYPVARQELIADGSQHDLAFDVKIERSSWVALRILPSSHTNPVFVVMNGKPIRASRRSAEWCLKGVDQCWSQKRRFIAAAEMNDATAAYDHAREAYRRILAESEGD